MKKNYLSILIFTICLTTFTSCNFNRTTTTTTTVSLADTTSLALSKKAIKYIKEGKSDSLNLLLNLPKSANSFETVIKYGQDILNSSECPNDSLIMVTETTKTSSSGTEVSKSYSFPFNNEDANLKHYIITTFKNDELINISAKRERKL